MNQLPGPKTDIYAIFLPVIRDMLGGVM